MLEKTTILPATLSSPLTSTNIPLTNFDTFCLGLNPVERLFLYSFPSCTEPIFLNTHIPNLKHSLSLALRRFFPLAGKLLPADPTDAASKPIFSYTEGDGVDFIVASSCHDFEDLVGNHPRQATTFAGLVPKLTSGVLAIQVTLFPNHGIGIGVTYHHGVADGSSIMHFQKTWASFSRNVEVEVDLPCLDRNVFPEPSGLADAVKKLKSMMEEKMRDDGGSMMDAGIDSDSVRVTFTVTRLQLENLRRKVLSMLPEPPAMYFSTFTLVTAMMWRCMVALNKDSEDRNEYELFYFFSDFRSSSSFPSNYMGNCIIPGGVKIRRDVLLGDDGIVKAPMAINEAIQIMKSNPKIEDFNGVTLIFSLAGSPKLGVYGLDFGWGRPRKVEVVHIGKANCMSLAENSDEKEGGVEIGVVLGNLHQFQQFRKLFCDNFGMVNGNV